MPDQPATSKAKPATPVGRERPSLAADRPARHPGGCRHEEMPKTAPTYGAEAPYVSRKPHLTRGNVLTRTCQKG